MSNPDILKAVTAVPVPQGAVAEGPGRPKETRPARPWPRRNRRGVGLFGVILGAAVIAAAILGLIALYQGAVNNTRTQTALNTVLVIDTSIRRTYANLPQFEAGEALEGTAISAVPSNAVQGTGTNREIVTPWGGRIRVAAGDNPGATIGAATPAASNNRFYITIAGLPETACEAIAAAFLNRPDVVGLDVENSGTLTAVSNATQIAAFDTVGEINTECDGDDNSVGIVFRG